MEHSASIEALTLQIKRTEYFSKVVGGLFIVIPAVILFIVGSVFDTFTAAIVYASCYAFTAALLYIGFSIGLKYINSRYYIIMITLLAVFYSMCSFSSVLLLWLSPLMPVPIGIVFVMLFVFFLCAYLLFSDAIKGQYIDFKASSWLRAISKTQYKPYRGLNLEKKRGLQVYLARLHAYLLSSSVIVLIPVLAAMSATSYIFANTKLYIYCALVCYVILLTFYFSYIYMMKNIMKTTFSKKAFFYILIIGCALFIWCMNVSSYISDSWVLLFMGLVFFFILYQKRKANNNKMI